jgi:uncharacterized membrane protein
VSKATGKDHLELWLSWLLRGGTLFALVLIGASFLLNLFTGQSWIAATDLPVLLSGSNTLKAVPPANLAEVLYGFRNLQSVNLVQAAILVLVLLPSLRVAFLMGNFARKRDWLYAGISAFVLLMLGIGFLFRWVE